MVKISHSILPTQIPIFIILLTPYYYELCIYEIWINAKKSAEDVGWYIVGFIHIITCGMIIAVSAWDWVPFNKVPGDAVDSSASAAGESPSICPAFSFHFLYFPNFLTPPSHLPHNNFSSCYFHRCASWRDGQELLKHMSTIALRRRVGIRSPLPVPLPVPPADSKRRNPPDHQKGLSRGIRR